MRMPSSNARDFTQQENAMAHPNLDLINHFFEAYGKRDHGGLSRVLADNVKWTALGQHPLSGVRNDLIKSSLPSTRWA
jgi:ketosteroid isomerase-like protein